MSANTQRALHEALRSFSHGDVEKAQTVLDIAADEERTRGDIEDMMRICCMRASIAAMQGESNVARLMAPAAGGPQHVALTCYLEGLASLAKSSFQTARMKFEEAKRRDLYLVTANLGLAAIYFQDKRYKECFSLYREVLEVLGSRVAPPVTRVGMGLCCYYLNRLDLAQKFLERAVQVDPENELALLALFVVYVDCRLIRKVTETVTKLRQLLPQNALLLLKVGDLMYFKAIVHRRMKNVLRPLQQLFAVVRVSGTVEERALADFQEGRLLLVCGDLQGAQRLLEAALRMLPTLLAARIHYARLLFFSGKKEEGVQLLLKINKEHPNQREVLQLLAEYATERGQHEAALQYCRRLTETVAQGDARSWSLAVWCTRLNTEECRRLHMRLMHIQREVGTTPPWTLLANVAGLNQDGDALQAIVDHQLGANFLEQPMRDVTFVPLIFNLALLLERSDRARARQLYTYLVQEQSCFRLPYFRLHTLAKEDGQPRQAIAWLALLQQVIPEEPTAQSYIGQTLFEYERFTAAISSLRASRNKSIPVALALGNVYLWCSQQHGRDNRRFLSSAKDRFLFVLRRDTGNILAAHGLACCLGMEEDFDHCQSLLDRVGEVKPNCAYVQQHHTRHMANVKALTESYKQALDYLEKIPHKSPSQVSSLAFCLACRNDYAKAIEVLDKVVEENPDELMLRYNLALIHCSAFIRSISRTETLSVTEGRKLRGLLERGLSHALQFTGREVTSHSMAAGRLFLKSVCSYCVQIYERSLNRLIAAGHESDAQHALESRRWVQTFTAYQQERQREAEERSRLEAQKKEEIERMGNEVLQAFVDRRAVNPLQLNDPDLIAANLADMLADPPEEKNITAENNMNDVLAGAQLGGDAPDF